MQRTATSSHRRTSLLQHRSFPVSIRQAAVFTFSRRTIFVPRRQQPSADNELQSKPPQGDPWQVQSIRPCLTLATLSPRRFPTQATGPSPVPPGKDRVRPTGWSIRYRHPEDTTILLRSFEKSIRTQTSRAQRRSGWVFVGAPGLRRGWRRIFREQHLDNLSVADRWRCRYAGNIGASDRFAPPRHRAGQSSDVRRTAIPPCARRSLSSRGDAGALPGSERPPPSNRRC